MKIEKPRCKPSKGRIFILLLSYLLISCISACSRSSEEKEAKTLFEKAEESISKQMEEDKLAKREVRYGMTHSTNCVSQIGTCMILPPQHRGSRCYCNDAYQNIYQGVVD